VVVVAILVGIAILAGFAVALSLLDGGLEEEPVDHPDLGLPERPLTAADVPGLRFRVGWRGYRMDDVDAALDRLAQSLPGSETERDS
jgi:DivIVA domain-containing protein